MFGFLELLENLEPSKRLFGARNEFGRTFLWERWHLSTRLLRPNDPKSGTFLTEKQGQKRCFLSPSSSFLSPLFLPQTDNPLCMNHLQKRPTFRSFASSSKQKRKVPLNLRHFVRIIHKVESLLSFRVNPQGDT